MGQNGAGGNAHRRCSGVFEDPNKVILPGFLVPEETCVHCLLFPKDNTYGSVTVAFFMCYKIEN